MNNYFKRRMELLSELKLKRLGKHEWGVDPEEETKVKSVLALEYPQEHEDWEKTLKEVKYRWKIYDPSKPIEVTKVLEDGTTLKVIFDPPVNVDILLEDIYVQHVDGLEDDDNSITLGYQITKEEFEELLRKS